MSALTALRVFHQRRIAVPVPDDALVLDVGSGDKPSWRADVLLDRYTGAEFAAQRSGRAAARVSRPLFDADAADMPFRDGAFDYAICSNLLEHVPDPAAVARELSRVARAGYIEVPEAASAKIVDFPSHVWWCRLEEGGAEGSSEGSSAGDAPTLVLTAKQAPYFDAEIHAYIERAGVRDDLDSVLNRHFEHRVIQYHWSGAVRLRTEGRLDPDFFAAALRAPGHQRGWEAGAVQALTAAWTLPTRRRRRDVRIPFNQVVKPEHQRADDAVLERRIYRLDAAAGGAQQETQ
ncbi:class I SAM-dependent methyltransferase [Nocardioides renjunii]|uniref:class I SAM-dependent methyltransferase n=1 Tax=Nocardioides renjunii TaxID=3095075 RepID=UPI002AFF9D35|nr:class I SAM-dependent methyltransferase [Nocardioides sp. S-34]WQQ24138.1 class I SAM-dependent methyltransferase [Nocardioides sp. S-34]